MKKLLILEQPDALRVARPQAVTAVNQKTDGGFLKPKTAWDSLSMREKAEMMKVAVRNGITSLQEIRQKYNEFAEGGDTEEAAKARVQTVSEDLGNGWYKTTAGNFVNHSGEFVIPDGSDAGYRVQLPEVQVIGKMPQNSSAKERQPYWVSARTHQLTFPDVTKGVDAAIDPLLHWMQPSQYVGAIRDAAEGKSPLVLSMLRGNSGVTSEEYAQEHPVLSTLFNIATDMAVPAGYGARNLRFSRSTRKPSVPEPFAEGTPAAQWAEAGNLTRSAAERGRNIMLNWIGSPFYKQRWQSAAPYEDVNPIIKDMAENTRLQQFNYRDRSALSNDGLTNGSTYSTSIKPDITITGDKTIRDYNTGFSIDLASDLGDKATSTSIHELSHLTSGMSGGLEPVIRYGKPIYGSMIEPVKSDYLLINETLIPRGKRYQHFMVDYNDGLLPQESTLLRDVFNNPQQAKESLMGIGRTSEEADQLISALKNSYSYLWDRQEQQAFLKQMFLNDVRPHLNNPNDAREIERFLIMNPEVLDNNPQVKTIMEIIRPGDMKRYAKYLAESLSVLPFINNSNKHQQ